MDVINISRSRRFLRERPMRVNLFDRPRMVVDVLCLEAGQSEARRSFDRSDSLLVLIEGAADLRAGPQRESLQEMDAALVAPGQEYEVVNTGAGQMTALVVLSPKPSRVDEVPSSGETRPFRRDFDGRDFDDRARGAPDYRDRPRPAGYRDARPARGTGAVRGHGASTGQAFRPGSAPAGRGAPRRYEGPRSDDRPQRSDGPRRYEGERSGSGPRREGPGGPRRYEEPRPGGRRGGPSDTNERGGPRRGSTGARSARSGDESGPVWYPRPKPAWRPRGAAPASGTGRTAGPRGYGASGQRRAPEGNEGRPPRRNGGASGGYRESGGRDEGSRRPPGGARRTDNRKTGDARKASRGQGPLSGRRGPGRSEPRT